jgi:hypothetical protein
MLIPGGDECGGSELQYVDVAQDLDQSPEGPRPTLTTKASLRSLTLLFKIMKLPLLCLCIYVLGVE